MRSAAQLLQEAVEKDAPLAEHDDLQQLLFDAMNATLNLSGAYAAQVPLARHGIWTFVALWSQNLPNAASAAEKAAEAGGARSPDRPKSTDRPKSAARPKRAARGGAEQFTELLGSRL